MYNKMFSVCIEVLELFYVQVFLSLQDSGLGMMYQFHPVSGTAQDDTPPGGQVLNYRINQMMMLSQMDEHFLRPILVLDTDLKVTEFSKHNLFALRL
jgi:hypothetical protein